MKEFQLSGHEFVELNHLLKITGLCASGGEAKAVIAEGRVKVDGSGGNSGDTILILAQTKGDRETRGRGDGE